MDLNTLAESVAPCALVCGLCKNATPEKDSCPGCKAGGGDDSCGIRPCCAERQLDGCWQCPEFPCDTSHFAKSNEVWRGLCIGSVECVKRHGLQDYVSHMVSRVGEVVEYGEYRFKTPQEIVEAFCGTERT